MPPWRLLGFAFGLGCLAGCCVLIACMAFQLPGIAGYILGAVLGAQAGRVAFAWWVGREENRRRHALKRMRGER